MPLYETDRLVCVALEFVDYVDPRGDEGYKPATLEVIVDRRFQRSLQLVPI